jgi:hypothetical protein
MSQTLEEITKIWNEWFFSKRAPAKLLNSEHNGATIAAFIGANNAGRFSLGNLDNAVRVLGDMSSGGKLQFNHEPPPAPAPHVSTPEEIEKRKARERRDFLNDNPLSPNAHYVAQLNEADKANEAAKRAAVDHRAKVEKEKVRILVQRRINNYTPQAPSGRPDFAKQERGQKEMQADFDANRMPNFAKWDC